MKKAKEIKREIELSIQEWSHRYVAGIFTFNVILALLVLLHSAGYFSPFLPLTINLIFFTSIIMATILLGFKSRGLFILASIFLILATFFRSVGISIWAERAGIYTYQALTIGVVLLILENIGIIKEVK